MNSTSSFPNAAPIPCATSSPSRALLRQPSPPTASARRNPSPPTTPPKAASATAASSSSSTATPSATPRLPPGPSPSASPARHIQVFPVGARYIVPLSLCVVRCPTDRRAPPTFFFVGAQHCCALDVYNRPPAARAPLSFPHS